MYETQKMECDLTGWQRDELLADFETVQLKRNDNSDQYASVTAL